MNRFAAPVVLVSIVVVAIQLSLLSSLRVFGAVIMLVWLWPLCAGLLGDQRSGVVAGLLSGLLFDAHVATPFGLFAVVGALVGYVAGMLGREDLGDLRGAVWWMPLAIGGGFGLATPLVLVHDSANYEAVMDMAVAMKRAKWSGWLSKCSAPCM